MVDAILIEEFIVRLASGIKARRLEMPVLLLLHMHAPLASLASAGAVVAGPLLAGLLGREGARLLPELFASPAYMERLIRLLEESTERNGGAEVRAMGEEDPPRLSKDLVPNDG
jgi:hypothetical protein